MLQGGTAELADAEAAGMCVPPKGKVGRGMLAAGRGS
jgi:hypothetical protein